jgi:uncharacterized protein YgiM (DUF1202 family)
MISMRNLSLSLLAFSFFFPCTTSWLQAENEKEASIAPKKSENRSVAPTVETKKVEPEVKVVSKKSETPPATPAAPVVATKFEPFTGKLTKNKVRLRIQANYDGPAFRELNRDDLIVVLGESDDFYAIQPPPDVRGYVFRSYVLDNVVEGDKVNIRLKPDREATIVAQLKAGDRIEGTPAAANNKWLEIKLPSTTRFYIAKDYVEKVGDVNHKERVDKKRIAASDLLNTTDMMSKAELQKPFDQMSIAGIKANYQHIINDYSEFPETASKAKDSLVAIQEAYTAKKVAYLEEQTRHSSSTIEANKKLNAELEAHKSKINHLQQQIEQNRQVAVVTQPNVEAQASKKPSQLPINMSAWLPVEEGLFQAWAQYSGKQNPQDFYEEQKQHAFVLQGIIDSYTRPIKNKPGDYMLLNAVSKLPIAFLYSTDINLQDYVGHEVTIKVSPRNNNNFAFPAYFVLTLE